MDSKNYSTEESRPCGITLRLSNCRKHFIFEQNLLLTGEKIKGEKGKNFYITTEYENHLTFEQHKILNKIEKVNT